MSSILDEHVSRYILEHSLRELPILKALREEALSQNLPSMSLLPESAQFLSLLVKISRARDILEIGTFIGYSTLSMALALPPAEGSIITCDISDSCQAIANRYWEKTGVSHKIHFKLGPAAETLDSLQQSFDLIFIDADKQNYISYYEKSLNLLKTGGFLVIDNILRQGKVADLSVTDPNIEAIRRFNEHVFKDNRVSISLIPVGDGLFLISKT